MRKITLLCILTAAMQMIGCVAMSRKTDSSEFRGGGKTREGIFEDVASGESEPVDKIEPLEAGKDTPRLATVDPRKVIYSARLIVVTPDVASAVENVRRLGEETGGYMQRMTNNAIVIRVPAEKFDTVLAEIEKTGPVTEKDVTAKDVTEQYKDLKIQLNNSLALIKKLRSLLNKAENVKDALAIEKELARVRAETERLQGKLNRLQNQVRFATISVSFMSGAEAPEEIRAKLPFWWLNHLGLEHLMNFETEIFGFGA